MSGHPEGPKLVGYAVLKGDGTRVYETESRARFYSGFADDAVEPVYTLPDYLAPAAPSLRQKITWAFTGAVLMGLACLAAVVAGGAV